VIVTNFAICNVPNYSFIMIIELKESLLCISRQYISIHSYVHSNINIFYVNTMTYYE